MLGAGCWVLVDVPCSLIYLLCFFVSCSASHTARSPQAAPVSPPRLPTAAGGGAGSSTAAPVNMDMSSFLTAVPPPMVSSPSPSPYTTPQSDRRASSKLAPADADAFRPSPAMLPDTAGLSAEDADGDASPTAMTPGRSAAMWERKRKRQVQRRGRKGGKSADWFFER